ncbi:CPBP family intramembrane glutamic endopeptidase [Lachnobacterium bovis]|uniref:CPBP family intramembrane glutamic endopeptidase n=1 Tax=Lachnobacterium bovis TaxID=140626 RepID=UPI000489CE60|nr:type II CAAX endopeptidase family protein [Lachnobacterium bovis]
MDLSNKEKIKILFREAFVPFLYYHGIFFFTVTIVGFILFGGIDKNYMICHMIGAGMTAFVMCKTYTKDIWWSTKKYTNNSRDINKLLVLIFVVIVIAFCLNDLLMYSPLIKLSYSYENTSKIFYTGGLIVEIIGNAILTPLAEEIIYRGIIFNKLNLYMKKNISIILSALIFGLAHGNIVQFVYAFVFGIIFACLVEKDKGIQISIILHMCVNLFGVLRTNFKFLNFVFANNVALDVILKAILLVGCFFVVFIYTKNND